MTEHLPTAHQVRPTGPDAAVPLTDWVGGTAGVLEQTARAVVKKVNPRTEPRMSYTHEK